jgi:serine/threonine protein kinase
MALHLAHFETCRDCSGRLAALLEGDRRLIRHLLAGGAGDGHRDEPEFDVMRFRSQQLVPPRNVTFVECRPNVAPARMQLPARLGQYELQSELARGGMGIVYRARHVALKRAVAVKVVSDCRAQQPSVLARFWREVELLGRVEHPSFVRATDAGECNDVAYLVMDLIEGESCSQLLRRHGRLSVPLAVDIARQVAGGLQYLHDVGLVHRDIKPSNLIYSNGVVRILDLGLSKALPPAPDDWQTSSEIVVGTADYIAPEQWRADRDLDIRADLYSLGCTLYALLTGAPPFQAEGLNHPLQKMHAHLEVLPRPLSGANFPPALAALVARLLAKRPADRFSQPIDVSQELERLSFT